jgi:hypothetical protein
MSHDPFCRCERCLKDWLWDLYVEGIIPSPLSPQETEDVVRYMQESDPTTEWRTSQ